jgi:hypothetical protein
VDFANLALVVVDEAGALFAVVGLNRDLLGEFAAHSFGVSVCFGGGVFQGYVAADADALLGVQPAFPLPFAARVLEQMYAAVRVSMAEDNIWNELFEAGVFLHFVPRPIARVLRAEQLAQVPLDVAGKALEMPEAMEQGRGHDEDVLGLHLRHGGILSNVR